MCKGTLKGWQDYHKEHLLCLRRNLRHKNVSYVVHYSLAVVEASYQIQRKRITAIFLATTILA